MMQGAGIISASEAVQRILKQFEPLAPGEDVEILLALDHVLIVNYDGRPEKEMIVGHLTIEDVEPGQVYSSQQVAEFLQVSTKTLLRQIHAGKLPKFFKVGKFWRIWGRDLLRIEEDMKRLDHVRYRNPEPPSQQAARG